MSEGGDGGDDASLVMQLAANDEGALKKLFELHAIEVYGYARSLVRRHDDAQEVVQQTFLTLWESRHRLVTYTGSALPWLLVTARNHANNLLRTRGRHEARFTGLDQVDATSFGEGPEDKALAEEARRDLEQALEVLSPVERQIIELCIEDDLLYKEAAVRLGLTHGAVRNRLSRVRSQLRARLGSREGATDE